LNGTVYDALLGDRPMAELVYPTELSFLRVAPSTHGPPGQGVWLCAPPYPCLGGDGAGGPAWPRVRAARGPPAPRAELRLRHPGLPAVTGPADAQCPDGGGLGPDSTAVRVLRTPRPLAAD